MDRVGFGGWREEQDVLGRVSLQRKRLEQGQMQGKQMWEMGTVVTDYFLLDLLDHPITTTRLPS